MKKPKASLPLLAASAASILVISFVGPLVFHSIAMTAVGVALAVGATIVLEFLLATKGEVGAVVLRLMYEEAHMGAYEPGDDSPHPPFVPDQFLVAVDLDGQTRVVMTDSRTFRKLSEGDSVRLRVSYGRLTGWMMIRSVVPPPDPETAPSEA